MTPGQLPKIAFSVIIIKFKMIFFIFLMKYHITLKFVILWAWMEFKHWIYPNFNIFSYSAWRRDINWISRWESFGNIIKHFFYSFLLSYTISRYYICSHYFNDFRKMIKNRIKVSHVTPGHYGRPLRNIIFFYFFLLSCLGDI